MCLQVYKSVRYQNVSFSRYTYIYIYNVYVYLYYTLATYIYLCPSVYGCIYAQIDT